MGKRAHRVGSARPAAAQARAAKAIGEERVRVRAYELYEKRGGGPGDAESDWYRAEAELRNETAERTR